ncbi:MAG: cytoskeleton protein RodZ [Pseudohongiellaceae bacterium]
MNKREILMPESSEDLSNKTTDNSVADDNASVAQNSTFPGRILCAARGELNYSIEQVAQELHLRPAVVLAMEEEKYEDFGSDVFLKGYFRSYCRLVNLHEERMVDLLESQLQGLQKDIDDAAGVIKKEQHAKKQKKIIIGLVLVSLIVVVLAVVASLFYTNMEPSAQAESPIENLSISQDSMAVGPLETVLPSAVNTEKSSIETEKKDAPLDIAIAETNKKKSEQIVNVQPVLALDIEPATNPVIENLPANISAFEAIFSGDCWFTLVDGNQKTVFAALKREGDRVSYSGITPFNFVLGDASKVVLSFNGETVNLKSHTANNGRAEITLTKG